jgi:hypothetical protein
LPLLFKHHRRQMTDGAVGSLFVVNRYPLFADGASLIKTFELRGIEHLYTERAVESFDVRVLRLTTWMLELPFDTAGLGPRLQDVAARRFSTALLVNSGPLCPEGRLRARYASRRACRATLITAATPGRSVRRSD